jgi:hypothetical protein
MTSHVQPLLDERRRDGIASAFSGIDLRLFDIARGSLADSMVEPG